MNNLAKNKIYIWFLHILRIALGGTFLAASCLKLAPLEVFLQQVNHYQIPLPESLLGIAGVLFIALETWIGLSLIFRSNFRLSLALFQLSLLFFIPLTIWGQMQGAASCGCYGAAVQIAPWVATVEDFIMLLLSLLLVPLVHGRPWLRLPFTLREYLILLVSITSMITGFVQLQTLPSATCSF